MKKLTLFLLILLGLLNPIYAESDAFCKSGYTKQGVFCIKDSKNIVDGETSEEVSKESEEANSNDGNKS